MKKMLLIDGNNMLFKAYHATSYGMMMKTSNGIPTNAVYGFVMMIEKALSMIQPDEILVAWDSGKPTFRHQVYAEYKGTRKRSRSGVDRANADGKRIFGCGRYLSL